MPVCRTDMITLLQNNMFVIDLMDIKPVEEEDQNMIIANNEVHVKVSKTGITKCQHIDQPYYAKGMCNKCYLKIGRNKLATKCAHGNRMMYAKQKCKSCYVKQNKIDNKNLACTKYKTILK